MKDKKLESAAIAKMIRETALIKTENKLLREQLRISEHRNNILHKYINNHLNKKETKNDRYN
jgi:hypothetical protein